MSVSVSTDGIKELIKSFGELEEEVDAAIDEGLLKSAALVKNQAIKNLRTPTAHHIGEKYFMQASATDESMIIAKMKIGKVVRQRKANKGRRYVKITTGAPHAWLVEYGTSRAPAHPYLRPAREQTYGEQVRVIEETVLDAANKAWRK